MTAPDLCPVRRDDDTIARWVAGTLEPDPAASFEAHLLVCPACQEAIQEAATIRAAGSMQPAGKGTRRVWWVVPVGLAAAVGLVLFRPGTESGDSLVGLGPAPVFEGAPIRAGVEEGTADRAMQVYQAGDYNAAARLFQVALDEAPSTALRFFLGASLLWSGRTTDAIPVLVEVVRDSVSPYASEAGLYLAKAYLLRGQADSALAVLNRSASRATRDPIAAHARALADSLRTRSLP